MALDNGQELARDFGARPGVGPDVRHLGEYPMAAVPGVLERVFREVCPEGEAYALSCRLTIRYAVRCGWQLQEP